MHDKVDEFMGRGSIEVQNDGGEDDPKIVYSDSRILTKTSG